MYKIDNRPKKHSGGILVLGIVLGIVIAIGGYYWFENTPNLIRVAGQVSENVTSQVKSLSQINYNNIAQVQSSQQVTDLHSIALQIHNLVNDERTSNGLPQLSWNEQISNVALEHSSDMIENNYVGHIDKQGNNAVQRMSNSAINCVSGYGGENIELLQGYSANQIPQNTLDDWNSDSEHKSNLLNPIYNSEGIGIFNKNGETLITEDFCELSP